MQRYEPPARPVPPPGVEDFDAKNWNDPNQCSEYAMDIFYYYKNREVKNKWHFIPKRTFFHACNLFFR